MRDAERSEYLFKMNCKRHEGVSQMEIKAADLSDKKLFGRTNGLILF